MEPSPDGAPPRRNRFGARFRMHGAAAFERAHEARVRRRAGPLLVYARPNGDLARPGDTRLGLSVSRRCGHAVHRHRLKRRIREAFRTIRLDLPTGYDLFVVVQPHDPLPVAEYRRLLAHAARELDRRWRSMPKATGPTPPETPPPAPPPAC
jgi:ribonuclease P protein component